MKKTIITFIFALLVSMAAWAETTYSKALEEKAIKGDADAMLELSTCYRFAMGVKKDIDWANYWLECAAKAGSTKALTVLTSLGDNGTGLRDAKRRELDSIVQRERKKFQNDDDPTIDYSTYNDALYRKAQGGNAKAQSALGDCYYYGYGVDEDETQAVYWYRKAAEQGDASGQNMLGFCYRRGTGIDQNDDKAYYWYRKSAEQDHPVGQNNLGFCYFSGVGVAQDYSQALYWYRKSADQNNAMAIFNLGYCYEYGYGVSKDMSQALYLYRKAADLGNSSAQDALTRLGADDDSSGDQTFTVGGVSFTMVYVEGGTFTMGATSEQGSDADSDEYPTHKVTLSSYYIGQTEVTQELWEAVMGSNPSLLWGSDHPVENVDWNDCQEFIRKLNLRTGKNFRLPTEAEWEYAARGGKNSYGYKYSGSDYANSVAWINDDDTHHSVATKRANELGIYDMSGNVWEWCSDWYDPYSSSSQRNPQGPTTGTRRVLRGGSWYLGASYSRVSLRSAYSTDLRDRYRGLRLAL